MQLVTKLAEESKVPGEDWDSLMWHNGKLFSGSYANGSISVWTEDLQPVTVFQAHDYPIYHLTAGEGKTFFTSSSDCTIKHWEENGDGKTFRLIATLEGHSEPPRKLRFVNGRLFSGDEAGNVMIWENGKCLGKIETAEEIWDMLAMEGQFATVRHVDVTLFSVGERDDKIRASVQNSFPGRSPLCLVESVGLLCCIDRKDNVVNIHDTKGQGNPLKGKLSGHEAIINAMIASSDGKHLYTGASDNSVIAWNLETCSQAGKSPLEGYVNALAQNPDGKVYAAGENKFIACLSL